MSSDVARPAPNRMRELFSRWHADHRRPQPGIGWSRRTWQSTLPEQHRFLTELPDRLDRATVAEYGRSAVESEAAALRTFVAAMVWGAIVASGSVVVSDVPDYGVVGGNPATLLRRRYKETEVQRLLAVAWWDWPLPHLSKHVRTVMSGTVDELEAAAPRAP